MSDLDALEDRIGAAMARIRAAAEAEPDPAGIDPATHAALEARAAHLAQELASVEAKRAEDVAQLDALIAELRPLVEESPDA
ncbi:MAG: hypothetical protein AAGJ96_09625 [Pseudomonadota bacterium]